MENRIVVDFNALDRIAKQLNNAGNELDAAMSILSGTHPTRAGGAYLRLSGADFALRSVRGSVSAANVAQVVSSYRSALKQLRHYSLSLSTGVRNTSIRFQQNERTTMGQPAGVGWIFNGREFSQEGFIPTTVTSGYVLKLIGDNWESSFLNFSKENKYSLEAGHGFKDLNKAIKEKLEKNGLRDKLADKEKYYKDGKEIKKEDAPKFYDRQATIAEFGHKKTASVSAFEGSKDWGAWGQGDMTIGKAEAYAGWSAGMYVLGADGKKVFSPGVKAECGASVTAFEANYKNQLLGDENLGVNVGATVTAGKAGAEAEAVAQVFGENGKLDLQLGASASAEVIGGEVSGKAAANILGGEVGIKGSVNYGIGAHADVGFRDGVLKFDIGASVGLGVSIGAEIDIGGMVNTVVDKASSAWEGISKGWNSFWGSIGGR